MSVTRTLNPLHFEDLEPHRFEDLIRQLAHSFRPWRSLEATGRKGKDQGVDIRGWEIVGAEPSDDDDAPALDGPEREWRIQVKRHKELGPVDMRSIVADAVPDTAAAPYGLIIAVACNVSADTMAVLRTETNDRGVAEAHLWTSAHLEDILFLPENDHLLFAYFGISLQVRARTRLARQRAIITVKRKLLQAFGNKDLNQIRFEDVLIRDIEDTDYADQKVARLHAGDLVAPWHPAVVKALGPRSVMVERFYYDGIVKPDGTWEINESTRSWRPGQNWDYWEDVAPGHRALGGFVGSTEDDSDGKTIHETWLLPYDNILEVDAIGDVFLSGPHLLCRFVGPNGPYREERQYFYSVRGQVHWLDDDLRRRPDG